LITITLRRGAPATSRAAGLLSLTQSGHAGNAKQPRGHCKAYTAVAWWSRWRRDRVDSSCFW
jgi:hypothetical protein